jgi:hypothetical protein
MSNNRRKFLKNLFAVAAGMSFFSRLTAKPKVMKGEKIKMLAPDGKIFEIEKSSLKQSAQAPATNKEVMEWMQTNNLNS